MILTLYPDLRGDGNNSYMKRRGTLLFGTRDIQYTCCAPRFGIKSAVYKLQGVELPGKVINRVRRNEVTAAGFLSHVFSARLFERFTVLFSVFFTCYCVSNIRTNALQYDNSNGRGYDL